MSSKAAPDRAAGAFAGWPAPDRIAWEAIFDESNRDFLDDRPRLATWAPSSIANVRRALTQLIRWATAGNLIRPGHSITEAITPEVLKGWMVDARRTISLRTLADRVILLSVGLEALAPDRDWQWLKPLIRRLERRARAEPPGPRVVVHAAQLYQLGLRLIVEDLAADPVTNLLAFRNGLIIALLAAAPMRIANLAALRIGVHVREEGSRFLIHLPADETKTRRADVWPIEGELTSHLTRYLTVIRPSLLRRRSNANTDRLWIGVSGRPIGDQVLRGIISKLTHQHLGIAINPHTFRHCAATSYALERPDFALGSSALLGHASPATTQKHYIVQQRQLVQRQYLTVLRARSNE